ncbi:DoxX family protein [Streptomyces sp. NPDC001743]|uniref:DoxX family protein n=1 Tax=Streptomyces sp. NPDC001743 TaxID=3154397 RepID=UPI00331F6C00
MPASMSTALAHVLGVTPAHRFRAAAPCVVRVAGGAVLAVHGLDKLIDGPAGFAAHLGVLGVPAPTVTAWAVALGESVGGVLLVVGLLSRLVAALLSLHLIAAIVLANSDTGFMTPQQGPATGSGAEFPLMLIAGFVVVLLAGPGPLALDRVTGLERGPAEAATASPAPAATATSAANALATEKPRASAPPSPVRASLTSGLIGGVLGAVMSALVNYGAVGMPASAGANAGNHAVSGLISGFLAGFLGLLTYRRKHAGPADTVSP